MLMMGCGGSGCGTRGIVQVVAAGAAHWGRWWRHVTGEHPRVGVVRDVRV